MCDLPVHKIKTEPTDDRRTHIEKSIPTFVVKPPAALLESSVEVIDLTDEHYFNEFTNFLTNLPARYFDKDARKNTTKAKSRTLQRTQCLPVDYLEYINFQQDAFIYELLDFTFTKVLLYGQLTAETVKDDVTIYRLDDGTCAVDVFFRPGNKKYTDNLTKLAHCDDLLRRKNSPLNMESVPDSAELRKHLRLLIRIARAQCCKRLNRVKLGTQCFVVGNPFIAREDKVCLFAHSMFPDDEPRGSCELFWKTYLSSFYEPLITARIAANDDSSMNDLNQAMDAQLIK